LAFIYRIFLKGLLTLLPITLTIYLLVWIATKAEAIFGDPIRRYFPGYQLIPGTGVLIIVVLIFLVGLLVNNYLTKRFFEWLERQIEHTPVIRSIYGPLRDVTNLFASPGGAGAQAQRVVMVRFDAIGTEMLGLMTRDSFSDLPNGAILPGSVAVFIPFSYGMGGFTVIVQKSQIRETTIAADRAMQLAITGWIKAPTHPPK
jgi:uncharacterized membrane protein